MSVWSDQAAGFLDIIESSSSEVWKHFLRNRHTEKARSGSKSINNCVKITKKHSKNSDFEYPELGH